MKLVKNILGKDVERDLITDVVKVTMHRKTQAKTPEEVMNNIRKK